jgi:hypothetical protein
MLLIRKRYRHKIFTSPLLRVQIESLESTFLAQRLGHIDVSAGKQSQNILQSSVTS